MTDTYSTPDPRGAYRVLPGSQVRYGAGAPPRRPEAPGFVAELEAYVFTGYLGDVLRKADASLMRTWQTPDPDFNPMAHMDGYWGRSDDLIYATNLAEMNRIKRNIDDYQRHKKNIAEGEWGWIAALSAGVVDPVNLASVPATGGVGFVAGVLRGAAANVALSAVTETVRHQFNPQATAEETVMTLGASALLGGMIGGTHGFLTGRNGIPRLRAGMQRFIDGVDRLDGENTSRVVDWEGQKIRVRRGNTGTADLNGRYKPIHLETVEVPGGVKQGPDGQNYAWVEDEGWRLEADLGTMRPRPVGQDVIDALGLPEVTSTKQVRIDEGALRTEYERGEWRNDPAIDPERIRNYDDFRSLRGRQELWRDITPEKAGETPAAYQRRVNELAMADVERARMSSETARVVAFEDWLDLGNRSLPSRAMRLYPRDPLLGDLPLSVAGDYGTAIRANRFGYRTPASVLVNAQRHSVRFLEIKAAVDEAWLRFVSGNPQAKGTEMLNINVTASIERMKRGVKGRFDAGIVTYDDFQRMVMHAHVGSTRTVRGHPIAPEAREAAKAVTRVLQDYDRMQRELGMYADQRSLTRTRAQISGHLANATDRLARFLWGGNEEPASLMTALRVTVTVRPGDPGNLFPRRAIRINERIYEGSTHNQAMDRARAEQGDAAVEDFFRVPGNLGSEWMGYIDATGRFVTDREVVGTREVVFTGETRDDALKALIESGPEGAALAEKLTPENWGYVRRQKVGEEPVPAPKQTVQKSRPVYGEAMPGARFHTTDEILAMRRDSLTPKQRAVVEDLDSEIATLRAQDEAAELALAAAAKPHRFLDQEGNPEAYWPHYWNIPNIVQRRAEFVDMIAAWFSRSNPDGARARASAWVDRLVEGKGKEEGDTQLPGLRHLNARVIDIPTSFVFGETHAIDFLEDSLLGVMEAYTHRAGAAIEMARMHGDRLMWSKLQEIRGYFFDRYIKDADDPMAEIARRDEYLGYVEASRDAVLGSLRERSPWAIDNRAARFLKQYRSMTSMGAVTVNSAAEIMRVPMINGFSNAFHAVFARFLGDMAQIKWTRELAAQTGESADMAKTAINIRWEESQLSGGMHAGGTSPERLLERLQPGYFKLVGLTPWTTFLKEWAGFAGQHRTMSDAIAIAAGTASRNQVLRSAANGIGVYEAHLLASMPVERTASGLILPAIQNWKGAYAAQARELLLNSLAADMRRAIVTPSIADKPGTAMGVYMHKGQKVFESELLTMPFQFLSYGIAAHRKLVISGLQGRDQSAVMGALVMFMIGGLIQYFRTPDYAQRKQGYTEWLLGAYETSGVGGLYFGDMPSMIERLSANKVGIRPAMGWDPKFGKQATAGPVTAAGPGVTQLIDFYRAFADPDLTTNQRAQLIRRGVLYNNVLWWGSITRDLARGAAEAF